MNPGDVVADRFEVMELAGRGGMGEVYRAVDRSTGATIALKLLHADQAEVRARFLREAKLLSEIRHPAVVAHVAHGQLPNGEIYLAMEWLAGEDLYARLGRGPVSVEEAGAVVATVADGLHAAHDRGVVHRDVKPSNIFLEGGDLARARLLDFGVARVLHQTRAMTETGAAIGTPSYMSPEQARGEDGVDARTDVFALGCVLYECIVGEPPFVGAHALAVLAKVLFHDPADLRSLVPNVPSALSDLVTNMLSKDAGQRPPDGAAVRDRLRSALGASLGPVPGATVVSPRLGRSELKRLFVLIASHARGDEPEVLPALAATELPALQKQTDEQRAVAEVARQYGARIETLLDGSLVAAWSASSSATDAAAQACRCALALRKLRPHDAIAVATGSGLVSGAVPSGEVIDRAATLARAHRPRASMAAQIQIDEALAGLLDARFDVQADDSGFVLRAARDDRTAPRTLLGKPTPCVGRDRELQLLLGSVRQSAEERVTRAVLVVAHPGSGKSRLRYELHRALQDGEQPVQLWLAHAEALAAGSPLGLIAELVRRGASIQEGEDATAAQRKLRARLGRHLAPDELSRIASFLGELAGIPNDEPDAPLLAARRDVRLMSEQMMNAFVSWVRAESSAGPLCIVLEDLHWGDASSVRFIEQALTELTEAPLSLIALARPEVNTKFPKLWERCDLVQINLPPLGKQAALRLIEHTLGQQRSREVGERLIALAAGNAFYLEELIRTVASGHEDLPDSILAMAQTRYEALDEISRQVLRAASIFGEAFWIGAVADLLPGELLPGLAAHAERLEQQELVSANSQARFMGERELRFRHALLREAAYAALPDDDKRLGHELAVDWLKRAGERDATALAEHCLRAQRLMEAAHHFRVAAEQALESGDFPQALARARRTRDLGGAADEVVLANVVAMESAKWQGDHTLMAEYARELMAQVPAGSLAWFRALADGGAVAVDVTERIRELERVTVDPAADAAFIVAAARVATQSCVRRRPDQAERLFERLQERMHAVTDPSLRGWFEQVRGFRAAAVGKIDVTLDALSRAAECFASVDDHRNACAQWVDVAFVLFEFAQYEACLRLLNDTEQRIRQHRIQRLYPLLRFLRGGALIELGRLDAASDDLEAARTAYAGMTNNPNWASVLDMCARLRLRQGKIAEAEALAREANEGGLAAATLSMATAPTLAFALSAQGRHEEALRVLGDAEDPPGVIAESHFGTAMHALATAEAHWGLNQRDAALQQLRNAHGHIIRMSECIADPQLRHSFLVGGANQRHIARLAAAWGVTLA